MENELEELRPICPDCGKRLNERHDNPSGLVCWACGYHYPPLSAPSASPTAEPIRKVLAAARSAIASLPEDALGRDSQGGWPYRDELLASIDKALNNELMAVTPSPAVVGEAGDPVSVKAYAKWASCPITHRPFFMNLEHPEMGEVPTFGGPFDSYTIPEVDDDGDLRCERYDHDAGSWIEGGVPVGAWLTTEQPCNHDLPIWLARHAEPEIACPHAAPSSSVQSTAQRIAKRIVAITDDAMARHMPEQYTKEIAAIVSAELAATPEKNSGEQK